jgi:uncharacterized membrane protein YdjX (TVP38/TMEM64 family)
MIMNRKRLILLIIIIILIALAYYFRLTEHLTLESLKSNRAQLEKWYELHTFQAVSIFMILYVVQTALSLPGATIFSLAAGALFGPVLGTLYAVISATIGATLAFLVTRYIFRDAVSGKFGSRLEKINHELNREGFNYLLFLRLVPLFPFFLINLAAGLTDMRTRTFFLGTLLGIIPGAFVYCNAGASLVTISSIGDIASPRVLASLILLSLFALVPVLYRKFRKTRETGEN